jgi:hypothetical protein
MYRRPVRASLQRLVNRLKRFFHRDPELPDDPYAMVGAPKKARPRTALPQPRPNSTNPAALSTAGPGDARRLHASAVVLPRES